MKGTLMAVGALVAAALVAACSTTSPAELRAVGPTLSSSPATSPFQLYTHCGIRETKVGNGFYDAVRPLDDGNGNPPPGWDNPYQAGKITRVSATEVVFTDDRGHKVEFRLRRGATTYRQICS